MALFLKVSLLSPEIFTPIWCRIMQTVGSSWSCLTEKGMPTTSTHSRRGYCEFFQHWTQLLNQSIIHLLHYNDFRIKFFEATMYFFNFFCQSVYCVICLFLSLQEKFNNLCFIQRLQCFLSINSSHNINKNVAGLKEYQRRIYFFTSIQQQKMRAHWLSA